jgi:hypothetical protein
MERTHESSSAGIASNNLFRVSLGLEVPTGVAIRQHHLKITQVNKGYFGLNIVRGDFPPHKKINDNSRLRRAGIGARRSG